MSWEDYLQSQAIYILANRPNNPLGLITVKNDNKKLNLDNNEVKKQQKKVGYKSNIETKHETKNALFKYNPLFI